MNAIKWISYLSIAVISFLIALITNNMPDNSVNGFYSYIFMGLWLILTIEFILKIKQIKDFNSSHNNFFLIFGALLIGTLYAIWGDYTIIFSDEILSDISINNWILIFSTPYMLYGFILLFASIIKYFNIYLGQKSLNSRNFVLFSTIFFIILNGLYILMQNDSIDIGFWIFIHEGRPLNLYIFLSMLIQIFLFVITLINKRPVMSDYSLNRVSNRLNDIDRHISDIDNFAGAARRGELDAQIKQKRERERQIQNQKRERELEKQRSARQRAEERRKKKQKNTAHKNRSSQKRRIETQRINPQRKTKTQLNRRNSSSLSQKELLQMKPKTGTLTEDDFKCIFCFELPKASENHRGIVLCPNCRYPAHADEFVNWVRTSKLCSRCDGTLPPIFIRYPKVIPVQTYLKAYEFWKKKFR